VNLNMPTGILREVPRDDASARLTHPAPDIDIPAAEDAVRSLLVALGQDPEAEHLKQTPRRVAAAYSELLTPDDFELTTFANQEGTTSWYWLGTSRSGPFASTTCCRFTALLMSAIFPRSASRACPSSPA
jgi:hypothetical protein